MTEVSPLCRRMIEDMTVRNLSPATQRYKLELEDVRAELRRILGDEVDQAAW